MVYMFPDYTNFYASAIVMETKIPSADWAGGFLLTIEALGIMVTFIQYIICSLNFAYKSKILPAKPTEQIIIFSFAYNKKF